MPRIPKNADKENFLLEIQWQQDRKRLKDAKKIRRAVILTPDRTYRIDVVKSGLLYFVWVLEVHAKSLRRVQGTGYDVHTICGEEGALLKMEQIAHTLKHL